MDVKVGARPRSLRVTFSYLRAGRLVPADGKSLRAGYVLLRPSDVMDWHSTRSREELLVVLAGRADLEVRVSNRVRRIPLPQGQAVLLAAGTVHRVVNRSRRATRYLYITAGRGML